MQEIILYSTGCPRCSVLKKKLEMKDINFTINESVDDMLALGIQSAPALGVDGQIYTFTDAVKFVNEYN